MKRLTIGLIINPIAGMGGAVGLKGTDGPEILNRALELGATPSSEARVGHMLADLAGLKKAIHFVTGPGEMGGHLLRKHEFEMELFNPHYCVVGSAEDTVAASKAMQGRVDLLLFAGGDGTARDVCSVIGTKQLTLGIPCGVKIQSGVFATNIHTVAKIIELLIQKGSIQALEAEVADIDEEAYRNNTLSSRLYGVMQVPYYKGYLQNRKSRSQPGEKYFQEAIAHDVLDNMQDGIHYLLGPGTTTMAITNSLGLNGSLLGVDVVCNRKLVGKDLGESDLLELVSNHEVKLLITPTGNQGFLLGRGNKQLSSKVLRSIGKENVIVLATKEKLIHLYGAPLLLDSGDDEVDEMLLGYYQVVTGYEERMVYRANR